MMTALLKNDFNEEDDLTQLGMYLVRCGLSH